MHDPDSHAFSAHSACSGISDCHIVTSLTDSTHGNGSKREGSLGWCHDLKLRWEIGCHLEMSPDAGNDIWCEEESFIALKRY
jgi:hypothetical protein